ncbi:MAG TPA: chemotaxis protein CheW [Polyangiales bacterium]|nr:chemotaxis protein CheW [Polyangiales bacterium]
MRGGRAYAATLAKDLVWVEVGTVSYAIEVARVREILKPQSVIELPRRRDFVLGVAEYRDEVVPVVDLRSLFGLAPRPNGRRTKWVILEASAGKVAIVVDAVLDVFSSAENPQRAVPVLDASHRERGIKSAYRHGDRLVFLLDANQLAEPAADVPRDEPSLLPSESP